MFIRGLFWMATCQQWIDVYSNHIRPILETLAESEVFNQHVRKFKWAFWTLACVLFWVANDQIYRGETKGLVAGKWIKSHLS